MNHWEINAKSMSMKTSESLKEEPMQTCLLSVGFYLYAFKHHMSSQVPVSATHPLTCLLQKKHPVIRQLPKVLHDTTESTWKS